jgi:hypothetical protein
MSFSDFKEVSINDPGTSSFYGADDLLEIMKIFNAKTVSNRQVKIKNPWVFQAHYDILASQTTPGNPAANTKRVYVEPSNNHLMVKASAGTIIDIDVLGQSAVGEVNTASNVGIGGIGVFKQKSSADLQFRNINAASSKITVALDTPNNEVDIDVAEGNLTHANIGGINPVTKGGTGLSTITSNALLKGAGTSNVALITTGTDGHILTMVAGAPAWAVPGASADTKAVVFEAGVQIGSVGRRLNFVEADDFVIAENAGADRFDITYNRAEYLVGSWTVSSGLLKNNIGTTYVDVLPASGTEGMGCDVDGNGRNDFRIYVSWDKNSGSGTHSLQVISQSTSDVLGTIPTLVNGRNVATGTLPSFYQNALRSVKLQAKSTVSTDDPKFFGCQLYYK